MGTGAERLRIGCLGSKICIKYRKHGRYSVSSTIDKKIHLNFKMNLFLTFVLINFLEYGFCQKSLRKDALK